MYVNVLKVDMKRTNIVIDEKLIKDGMKATEIKTRRALVDYALRDLLRPESQKRILELERKVHGQVGWMPRLPTGKQAFLLQGRGGRQRTPALESKPTP